MDKNGYVECDWCGKMVLYSKCHTYRAAGPYYDEMYTCDECYKKSIKEKEDIKWVTSKSKQQKSGG